MDDKDLRKQRDLDDYNRELAGVGTRPERFFANGSPKNRIEEKRKSDRRMQTQLDLLMMNPVFAAAYEAANTAIDDTQKMLNEAMSATAKNIERLTDLTEDMEERTAKLEDGTAVFRDSNGRLRTADGRHLSEAETASLLNPENLLSYDSYAGARDALNSARARQDKHAEIQTDIDDARDRVKAAKTPEELEVIIDDMEKRQDEIKSLNSVESNFEQAAAPTKQEMLADLGADMQMPIR